MRLLTMLIVLSAALALASHAEADCCAELTKTANGLEKTVRILKEEKTRWSELHGNPITDKASILIEDRTLIFSVTIDTSVKNEVNSLPIRREYRFDITKEEGLLGEYDLLLGASAAYASGLRPWVGAGLRPFRNSKMHESIKQLGLGAYTSLLSAGGTVYYTIPKWGNLTFGILLGITYDGMFAPGIGIGISL